MKSNKNGNVYRQVNSLEDIRRINRTIRREMSSIQRRPQLTELKRRSDYLCTLTQAPGWKKKFGSKSARMLSVAQSEDVGTTSRANAIAKRRDWDVEYDPWGN